MTIRQINTVLRRSGIGVRVTRGPGYCYWIDESGDLVVDADCVAVYRPSDLPMEEWIAIAKRASEKAKTSF